MTYFTGLTKEIMKRTLREESRKRKRLAKIKKKKEVKSILGSV